MNKRNVRRFKNRQIRLAKEIADGGNFTISYEQRLPSIYYSRDKERFVVGDTTQIIFPTDKMTKGKKHRMVTVMQFEGSCDRKKVGRILKRGFTIKELADGGYEVRTSYSQATIARS